MFDLILARVVVIALCMVGAAFFSGIETGVVSIHRLRLQHFVRQGSRRALILQGFLDDTDRLLGTTLAGTNLCIVITSVVGASLAYAILGPWGEALSTALCAFLLLVFAEYLPKAWFYSRPFERSYRLAGVLAAADALLRPLSGSVVWLTRWIVPGRQTSLARADPSVTKDELKLLARQGEEAGELSAKERSMIHRVFDLSNETAASVMLPRDKIAFVYGDTTIPQFREIARASRFTRMPILDRQTNAFVGIVNVFQVVSPSGARQPGTIAGFARPPLFVPQAMSAAEILPRMRRLRQPMALVADGRNEVIGLLTTEDILEEIVGKL